MGRYLQLAAIVLLGAMSAPLWAGDVIDRLVATVNGTAILLSDVDQAVRVEALLEGRPLAAVSPAEQESTLQRLVDQELLRQQMGRDFPPPTAAELSDRVRQVRAQIPGAQSEQGWTAILGQYGLSESELAERVAVQMQIGRFVESRLRPGIHVDSASVQAYYRDQLVPRLRSTGVMTEPPLSSVSQQIEDILVQQRMDEMLSAWLRNLRQQSRIRTGPASDSEPSADRIPPNPGGISGR